MFSQMLLEPLFEELRERALPNISCWHSDHILVQAPRNDSDSVGRPTVTRTIKLPWLSHCE